jgi:membrane-bound ClpP family serine protease
MKKKLTLQRLISAIVSMAAEQAGLYAVWRWLLPRFGLELPVWVVAAVMSVWLITGAALFALGTQALGTHEVKGLSSMIGMAGTAQGPLNPSGTIKIHGELWNARVTDGAIESGEDVIVTAEDGLNLVVKKKN